MRYLNVLLTGTGLSLAVFSGCAADTVTTSEVKNLYRGDLDDCHEVRLVHESVKHQVGLKPEERYERLSIVVRPRQVADADYALKRVGASDWPSQKAFHYTDVDARCDAEGQRIWFVDRTTQKVIGSVDRRTGQTSGPDDVAPAWATADGGRVVGK